METVLLAALLARGNLKAESGPGPSPAPAPRGAQQAHGQPGANPEGGQGLGAFLGGC